MVADLSSKPGRFSSKFLFYQFGVLGGVSARSHFRVVKVGASPKFNRSRVSASQIDPSIADVGDLKLPLANAQFLCKLTTGSRWLASHVNH